MSDQFFREVDEAVRHERYRALWDRYGLYAIGAAALIVIGVASFKGWTYWQQSQAEAAGSKFTNALALEESGDEARAREVFQQLAAQGPAGYQVLSRLQLAMAEAKAGNREKAVELYDAIAADSGTDRILKGLAQIQAATLRLDHADYAEMEKRLSGLIERNSAWEYSARELLGLSAYKQKNVQEAEKQFGALIADEGTPANLRERATMMLKLIVGAPQALSTTAN